MKATHVIIVGIVGLFICIALGLSSKPSVPAAGDPPPADEPVWAHTTEADVFWLKRPDQSVTLCTVQRTSGFPIPVKWPWHIVCGKAVPREMSGTGDCYEFLENEAVVFTACQTTNGTDRRITLVAAQAGAFAPYHWRDRE